MNNTINKDAHKAISKQQEAIINRYERLVRVSVKQLAKGKRLSHMSSLTDVELARLMYEVQLERDVEMSPRELRKIARLNDGEEKFAARLKELGGTCGATAAAGILKVKRQTVDNRQKANKLLSVKIGSQTKYPIFQFNGDKTVDGLEEILSLLGDISDVTKISFFTGLYFFDDESLNVIDAMKEYGVDSVYMDKIRKQASLFGRQESH